jgi:hypothetical protein
VTHQENASGDPAIPFRDPAPLPLRIEVPDEGGGNLRDERLEGLVPSVFLRIEQPLPVRDPADLANTVRRMQGTCGAGPPMSRSTTSIA